DMEASLDRQRIVAARDVYPLAIIERLAGGGRPFARLAIVDLVIAPVRAAAVGEPAADGSAVGVLIAAGGGEGAVGVVVVDELSRHAAHGVAAEEHCRSENLEYRFTHDALLAPRTDRTHALLPTLPQPYQSTIPK